MARQRSSGTNTNTVVWGDQISHLAQDGVTFAYSVRGDLYIIPELQGKKVTCVARNVASFVEGKSSKESIQFVSLEKEIYSLTNLHFVDAQLLIMRALNAYKERLNQLNHGQTE